MVIAGVAVFVRGLVAKIVGFVNDNQVVVAPIDVGKINVAGHTAIAGKVGVVQNIIMETVRRKDVPLIVRFVERPVVAQSFWNQHQHAVVPQFVVFDDGESLESFAEANTVGNDAT